MVSPGTNKTDHHEITEILLKVALNTIILTLTHIQVVKYTYRLDTYESRQNK